MTDDVRRTGRPTILLFYDGYELKARERPLRALYHAVRSQVRFLYGRVRGKHKKSGFYVAFRGLEESLKRSGYAVRVNDFRAARRDPSYPIGLCGYPSVLDHVRLPNPVIFGPGDPGYPDAAGVLAQQPRIRRIIQPSDWYVDYYRPFCGDKMLRMPIGIDLDTIRPAPPREKSVDVLIYDKIRWYRDRLVPELRERLVAHLDRLGLTHETIVYEHHTRAMYFAALRRSRTMAFLCEHETQGLACEEALATDVPVFAWEEGRLVDPLQLPFVRGDLRVSSVPYFGPGCGSTFTHTTLESDFDRFWSQRAGYAPRAYVADALSMAETAAIYSEAYFKEASAASRPA